MSLRDDKLYRYPENGYLGGVSHGLFKHLGGDPILWRLAFLLFIGPIVYILMWIIVKKK